MAEPKQYSSTVEEQVKGQSDREFSLVEIRVFAANPGEIFPSRAYLMWSFSQPDWLMPLMMKT